MAPPANPIAEPTLSVNSKSYPNHTTKLLSSAFARKMNNHIKKDHQVISGKKQKNTNP